MSSTRTQSGQTLVFALVLMVILALAALFLFDYQSIIRSKLKVEIASQAGALAAANWQREGLNLIGELNVVKASTALLTEIPPRTPASAARKLTPENRMKILASERVLTEMQTRVSFVAPVIALGAAEQAVKNNGVNGEPQVMNRAVTRYIEKLLIDEDMRYTEPINGYYWRGPYIAMLQQLMASTHLAVRPNGVFAGVDHVNPSWLGQESLYAAINNQNWCHPTLNRLIKDYPDEYWRTRWYNVDLAPAQFPGESEIFTLDIAFARPRLSGLEQDLLTAQLQRYQLSPNRLPNGFLAWALYGASWFPDMPEYTGPDLSLWQGPERDPEGGGPYYYLRRNLKPAAKYGGPVAAVELNQAIPTATRHRAASGDEIEMYDSGLVDPVVEEQVEVGNYSVARAIGEIPDGSGRAVTTSRMVLPVFTQAVLIPGSMLRYRMMPNGSERLETFLIWLSITDSLTDPTLPPPGNALRYWQALLKLVDPAWRRQGWNPTWRWYSGDEAMAEQILSGVGDRENPGWLQAPVIYRQMESAEFPAGKLVVVRTESGAVEYHWGRAYFVEKNGTLVTNEEVKCFASGGPGSPGGIHTGAGHR